MTERIDHVAVATERLDLAQTEVSANWPSRTGEEKADLIAAAQVHATLALVEQQRIANIIAFTTGAGYDMATDLAEQIAKDLGTWGGEY